MLTVTKTLDSLVDDALAEIARYDERGFRVVSTSNLGDTTGTTVTIDNGLRVSPSDVIEFDNELVLVTAVSADPIPVLTIARGYDGTTAATHASGTAGTVNPIFARRRIARWVQRAFARLEAKGIFNVASAALYRTTGEEYFVLPADCRDVLRVGYMDGYGRFEPKVDGWRFFDDMPTSIIPSGRIVRVPRYIQDTDQLIVTYRAPFRWSTYPSEPVGSSTISMPESTQDLPSMYAACCAATGREMSRQDVDRSEEWNRSQGYTSGISTGLVRQKWQEFYSAVDDARRLYVPEIPRPFVRSRRFN